MGTASSRDYRKSGMVDGGHSTHAQRYNLSPTRIILHVLKHSEGLNVFTPQ